MVPDTREKSYLGDSVYCIYDGGGCFILTTENGVPTDPSNEIYIDDQVLKALIKFTSKERP